MNKQDAIQSERPDLYKQYTPWYQIGEPDSLKALGSSCGATNIKVCAETDLHQLATPEDWWTMVMGCGNRGTIDRRDAATQMRVKSANLEFLKTNSIRVLESDVLYALAWPFLWKIAQK
jgi:hypothetical protein